MNISNMFAKVILISVVLLLHLSKLLPCLSPRRHYPSCSGTAARTSTLGSKSSQRAPNRARADTAAARTPHSRVLEQYAVVDEADVSGRVCCEWSFLSEQVEDAHGQAGVLAVLYEIAQVRQIVDLRLGVVLDDGDDGVGDGGLVVESSLVAKHPRVEVHEDAVFLGELCAEAAPPRS